MNKNIISCPACGSEAVVTEKVEREISLSFGVKKTISIDQNTCSECGMQGDFTGINDTIISESYDKANLDVVNSIVEDFAGNKTSMAAIERSLDLPQRTLTKWKNNLSHPSSTGVALMKMIGTFPWLLDVAEANYDPAISQKIFIKSAVDTLMDLMVPFRAAMMSTGEEIQASGLIFYYQMGTVGEQPSLPIQQPQQYLHIASSAVSSIGHVTISK